MPLWRVSRAEAEPLTPQRQRQARQASAALSRAPCCGRRRKTSSPTASTRSRIDIPPSQVSRISKRSSRPTRSQSGRPSREERPRARDQLGHQSRASRRSRGRRSRSQLRDAVADEQLARARRCGPRARSIATSCQWFASCRPVQIASESGGSAGSRSSNTQQHQPAHRVRRAAAVVEELVPRRRSGPSRCPGGTPRAGRAAAASGSRAGAPSRRARRRSAPRPRPGRPRAAAPPTGRASAAARPRRSARRRSRRRRARRRRARARSGACRARDEEADREVLVVGFGARLAVGEGLLDAGRGHGRDDSSRRDGRRPKRQWVEGESEAR